MVPRNERCRTSLRRRPKWRASLSTEEYIIGSFILDVLAEALAGLRDALRLLLGIAAAYTQYVNYICRCVLPLFAGWYQMSMRRCERYKHLGIIKSLAFNRPRMRNQAGSLALYNMMVITHGQVVKRQELINSPSNEQI